METLSATYRIITPMFIGDGNQQATAIRPPSVKGALRFWWRALQWSKIRQNYETDEAALRNLHEEEARLFGCAADERNPKSGQGKFLLSIKADKLFFTDKNIVHPQFSRKDAARYLGYGLMEAFTSRKTGKKAGQLIRSCINEDQKFTVQIRFRDEVDDSLQDALIALGLLGGLGSRSRHGLGSISLLNLSMEKDGNTKIHWTAPDSIQRYKEMVHSLMKYAHEASGLPPYSAFSVESRVDALVQSSDPYEVLQDFAKSMLMYRSWGKNGCVLNKPREGRFIADHDWSKGIRPPDFHPRRVIFGLPHNYGKPEIEHVTPENYERRASPLLFHVHQLGEGQFIGTSILLKSVFLPPTEKINAGGNLVPQHIEWPVITDFLDGLSGADGTQNRSARFPNKIRII